MNSVFFNARTAFSVDASQLSPLCLLALMPLIGCDRCGADQTRPRISSRASSSFWGCHCPVRGWVCSLAVGVEAPRSVSELHFFAAV